ncbi:MAG: RICIN domain-containing protein [Mycobacterium sp.]
MGGVGRALIVVSTVLGVAVLGAGVAHADDPVQLRNRAGDFCLDRPDGSIYPKTVINPCNGSLSQLWILLGTGQIQSAAFPAMCLSKDSRDYWAFILACLNPGYEVWAIQPNGLVQQQIGGRCLTPVGDVNPGNWVSTSWCNGDAAEQQWDVVP